MVMLICCVWSSVIGECVSLFLKVFHYSFVRKSLVNMCFCVYFQDSLIRRLNALRGGVASLTLPHVFSFVLWLIHSVFVPLPVRYLHLVPPSAPLHGPKSICIVHDYARTSSGKHGGSQELVAHMTHNTAASLMSVSGLAIELCRALHSPGTDTQIQCQQRSGSLHMLGLSDA